MQFINSLKEKHRKLLLDHVKEYYSDIEVLGCKEYRLIYKSSRFQFILLAYNIEGLEHSLIVVTKQHPVFFLFLIMTLVLILNDYTWYTYIEPLFSKFINN